MSQLSEVATCRTVYYQFESGDEGSDRILCCDGPYRAETLEELESDSRFNLAHSELPRKLLGRIDWHALWHSAQESEDGFFPVTVRWPGRWLRVVSVSRQMFEDAMAVEDAMSFEDARSSPELPTQRPKTIETLADELAARRELLASVVESFYPADQVIYRAMSGAWTGAEMAALIRSGDPIGRHYAESLLMVCRDALARQAARE